MNLHTPYPYWLLKNGFLFEYPALRHSLQVDFLVMGGGITGALTAWCLALEDLDFEYSIRQKHGIRVERWDKADVDRALPHFKSPGALYSPHDGAQVDAYSLTHALLQDAMKHGAQVFDKTEIVDIRHEKEQVVLCTNHGHSIRAKQLVIASGYKSQAYLEQKVTRMHSAYVLVSEPFEGEIWHRDALIWETAAPVCTS
jgi:glycine/D-amino acid oxidase-like deaminating enzyme